jgi:hypothetical protein
MNPRRKEENFKSDRKDTNWPVIKALFCNHRGSRQFIIRFFRITHANRLVGMKSVSWIVPKHIPGVRIPATFEELLCPNPNDLDTCKLWNRREDLELGTEEDLSALIKQVLNTEVCEEKWEQFQKEWSAAKVAAGEAKEDGN